MEESKEELPNISKRSLKKLKRRQNKLREVENKNKYQLVTEEKLKTELSERALADLITQDILNETEYYFENGFRKVKPYHYDFIANAKGRWFGRSLVQVFSQEFQYYSEEKCRRLIAKGTLRVAKKVPTSAEHVICNGDIIINTIHRHELPVTAERIAILEETDEMLVINKPPSMPIHPCGRYRHNCLLYILAKEYGYLNLRVAHRLDRLTSGLVLLCKTAQTTRRLMQEMRERRVRKVYLSKVEGVFPSCAVVCEEGVAVLSHNLGIYRAGGGGKKSKTTFTGLSTDGTTSIVRCEPHTGRTHQIRVHLQFLGYPIVNDPTYNHPAWGPEKGKRGNYGKSEEQLIADLSEAHKSCIFIDADDDDTKTDNKKNNDDDDDDDDTDNKKNNDDFDAETVKKDVIVEDASGGGDDADDVKLARHVDTNEGGGDDDTNEGGGDDDDTNEGGGDDDDTNEGGGDDDTNEGGGDNDDTNESGGDNDEDTNKEGGSHDNDGDDKISRKRIKLDDESNCIVTSEIDDVITQETKNKDTIKSKGKSGYDSDCGECHVRMREPRPEEMFICLHALSYEGPGWKYQTEAPSWANCHS